MLPFYANLGGACLVGGVYHHADEFGLVKLGNDRDLLPLLDGNTLVDDELGILFENSLFHVVFLSFGASPQTPPKTFLKKVFGFQKILVGSKLRFEHSKR
jgi:hypothetical protein